MGAQVPHHREVTLLELFQIRNRHSLTKMIRMSPTIMIILLMLCGVATASDRTPQNGGPVAPRTAWSFMDGFVTGMCQATRQVKTYVGSLIEGQPGPVPRPAGHNGSDPKESEVESNADKLLRMAQQRAARYTEQLKQDPDNAKLQKHVNRYNNFLGDRDDIVAWEMTRQSEDAGIQRMREYYHEKPGQTNDDIFRRLQGWEGSLKENYERVGSSSAKYRELSEIWDLERAKSKPTPSNNQSKLGPDRRRLPTSDSESDPEVQKVARYLRSKTTASCVISALIIPGLLVCAWWLIAFLEWMGLIGLIVTGVSLLNYVVPRKR